MNEWMNKYINKNNQGRGCEVTASIHPPEPHWFLDESQAAGILPDHKCQPKSLALCPPWPWHESAGDLSDFPLPLLGWPLTINGILSSYLLHCIKCLQVVKLKVFIPVQQIQLQLKICLGRRISLWQPLQEIPENILATLKWSLFGWGAHYLFLLVYFSCFPTPGSLILPKTGGNAPPQVP